MNVLKDPAMLQRFLYVLSFRIFAKRLSFHAQSGTIMKNIAKIISDLRKEKGWSQTDLAKESNILPLHSFLPSVQLVILLQLQYHHRQPKVHCIWIIIQKAHDLTIK